MPLGSLLVLVPVMVRGPSESEGGDKVAGYLISTEDAITS